MNRILVVDDLPIIVNSMIALLEENERLALEAYKAYSAIEAMEILKKVKIDIVLTDIGMPVVSGLELLQEIRLQWPRCKVIFLTCYSDFNYAQEAIKSGGFDYILKTEKEEKILQSIQRAIDAIHAESQIDHLIEKAKENLFQAKPMLQKELFRDMMNGRELSKSSGINQFIDLDIPLDYRESVMLLIGRIDHWRNISTISDRELILYAIQNIANELLNDTVRLFAITEDGSKIIWFIQFKEDLKDCSLDEKQKAWQKVNLFVYGMLESIQEKCLELLKLPVSFLLSNRESNWHEICDRLHVMKMKLNWGLSLEGAISLDNQVEHVVDFPHNRTREQVQLLDSFIQNNCRKEFFEHLNKLMEEAIENQSNIKFRLFIYHSLSSMFISSLFHMELDKMLNEQIDLNKLYGTMEIESWNEIKVYFFDLAERLFDEIGNQQQDKAKQIVDVIHDYIHVHLENDVSLSRLSDVVQLNPSYLSRLYKQTTGTVLSEYIAKIKLERAKHLLQNKDIRVQEIAISLGYNSGLAFTRFFKQHMNVTPQEFRHALYQRTDSGKS